MIKLKGTLMALASSGLLAASAATMDAELHAETSNNDLRFKGVFPENVKTIALITPASYPGSPSHKRGIELIQKAGYQVKIGKHAFDLPPEGLASSYASSSLEGRLEDFYAAWNDMDVDMILCIRGGIGSFELLENLDWSKLKKRPELIVMGYSDVTLILCALLNTKMGHPVAGPMCGSLTGLKPESLLAMKKAFHGETIGPVKLTTLVPGNIRGRPLAGHLERLRKNWSSPLRADVKGRVVFIECVRKPMATCKEYLNELYDKEFFKDVAGVVFCHFTNIEPQEEMQAFIDDFAKRLGKPAYKGFPFGHESQNFTIDFSKTVVIENGNLTIQ